MKTTRQSGNMLLAVICVVAAGAIIYVGYKLMKKLMDHPFDPYHGQGTNVTDVASSELEALRSQYPNAQVLIPNSGTVLPLESLTQNWYYAVSTSTNLLDWVETGLDWDYARELARTNHDEPARFYKLNLITQ